MLELNSLLVERYRPQTLEDLVLTDDNRAFFESLETVSDLPHVLFVSAPGSGKTTLAKVLVNRFEASHRYINASDERGIDVIREKVVNFAQTKSLFGETKIMILDEVDGLTGDAQRALRNTMEEYNENVHFILTANYKNRVIEPVRSRCQIFELVPPMDGCVDRVINILKAEKTKVSAEQKGKLIDLISTGYPDLRRIINDIQKFTIDGVLDIKDVKLVTHFAQQVVEKIYDNDNVTDIRQYVIENEVEFNSDYHALLKGMYEYVFDTVEDEDQKRESMLALGHYMESHQAVMDFEINAFCCIIQLLKIFN